MIQRLKRTILLSIILIISFFISGIFMLTFIGGFYHANNTNSPFFNEIDNKSPQYYLKLGILEIDQDGCCGHVDITPPQVKLLPPNDSIILSNTTILLEITDDNPMDKFEPKEVLYHWEGDQTNITLEEPYEIVLPAENGDYILYLYARDSQNNWNSIIVNFTITSDSNLVNWTPSSETQPTTTDLPRRSSGFLFLPVSLALIISAPIFAWKKRKKEL